MLKLAAITLLYFTISIFIEVQAGSLPKSFKEGLPKEKAEIDVNYDGFAYTDPTGQVVLNSFQVASRIPCGNANQQNLFADTNPPVGYTDLVIQEATGAATGKATATDKGEETEPGRSPAALKEASEEEPTPLSQLPPEKWVTYHPCEQN